MEHLTNQTFRKYLPLDIIAYSHASPGAMGEPGNIILVTKDGTVYYLNYYWEAWTMDELYELCPALSKVMFEMYDKPSASEGWVYFDLGMGNDLCINKSALEWFSEHMSKISKHPWQVWRVHMVKDIDEKKLIPFK